MKKYLLTIFISMFSMSSFAQLSFSNQNQSVVRFSSDINPQVAAQLEKSARYNGAIIGYGIKCNVPISNIQKVENFYVRNLNRLNLDKNNLNVVFSMFNNAKESVKTNLTTQECNHIRTEYDKILRLIN